MNVYVETNFVLELALVQEQHPSCEQIIRLCETGDATLVLPAFCIAESYETLIRRTNRRTRIANDLVGELRQLSRSGPYKDEVNSLQSIGGLLVRSSQEEDQRLIAALQGVLRIAEIIPLQAEIVLNAARYREMNGLQPQDSIVYSSVLYNLSASTVVESCFINRNRRDFDDPEIEENLSKRECKMLFSFLNGYDYVRHRANYRR